MFIQIFTFPWNMTENIFRSGFLLLFVFYGQTEAIQDRKVHICLMTYFEKAAF